MQRIPKILYIMGTARSGSTILEIMLSVNPQIFGAGELTHVVRDFLENRVCSCGKPCNQCVFWQKVFNILSLSKKDLLKWKNIQKKIDWHDGFIRQCIGIIKKEDHKLYKKFNKQLYLAITKASQKNIILDSSKYAGRALALTRLLKADIQIICLTRSPSGLMASFQKPNQYEQKPKTPFATVLYYVITLSLLKIASLILNKRLYRISYEDLIKDPIKTIYNIQKWSGLDLSTSIHFLQKNKSFPVGHLITANRLRKKGQVNFDPKIGSISPRGFYANLAVKIMNFWKKLLNF